MSRIVRTFTQRLTLAACAALALGGAMVAAAAPAEAGWRYGPYGYYHVNRGWGPGPAAAVGAIGGLALGAALAAPRPAYVYADPVYAPPPPAYAPPCYLTNRRVWVPGWGWEIRRERVCDAW